MPKFPDTDWDPEEDASGMGWVDPVKKKVPSSTPGGHPNGSKAPLELPPAGATPPAEGGGGQEAGGVPEQLRTETAKSIYAIFHGLDIAAGRTKEFEKGHERILALSKNVIEDARLTKSARQTLAQDLRAEIEQAHHFAVLNQQDIPEDIRLILATPQGRVLFRVRTFNQLCEEGKFGLQKRDRIIQNMTGKEFDEYAENKLKDFWREFDEYCSLYDMSNTRRVLDGVVEEIARERIPKSFLDRFRSRGITRAKLMENIADRVSQEMKDSYTAVDQSRTISRFLLENGGDLALKGAAIGLLAVNPLLALGVWGTRGIMESMGADFGSLLRKIASTPVQLAKQGVRGFYSFVHKALPPKWKVLLRTKMPETHKWLIKKTPPDFEKVSTGSLTSAERKALLLKGFAPLPEISVPALRWLRPRAAHLGRLAMWKGKEVWAKKQKKEAPKKPELKVVEIPPEKRVEKVRSTDVIARQQVEVRKAIFNALKDSLASLGQQEKKAS